MFGTRRAFTSREASKKNIAPDLLACHRTTTRNESLEHTGYTTEREKKSFSVQNMRSHSVANLALKMRFISNDCYSF